MPNFLPFSLYIHIPYCLAKCPYCDFNSYGIRGDKADVAFQEVRYIDALISELSFYAEDPHWKGRTIKTVFLGGGTPSLLASDSIARLLATGRERFAFEAQCEVTIEANPGTLQDEISLARLRGYRDAGVNRISLGAQSFSNKKLKTLGRLHSADETKEAVALVKESGIKNFNLDLMFGIRGETIAEWQNDLHSAIELQPRHISAYSLTLEPGTEFFKRSSRGEVLTAGEDIQADLYELTQEMLSQHGYEQYEISNYAQLDASCQHNMSYWDGSDYLGLGAGAHSFAGQTSLDNESYGRRWSNVPGPDHYIERALAQGSTVQNSESLSRDQALIEFFSLGLRTTTGICEKEFEHKFQQRYATNVQRQLLEFEKNGLLVSAGNRKHITQKGFVLADGIISALL